LRILFSRPCEGDSGLDSLLVSSGGREAGRQGGREAGRQGGREAGRQGGREAGRQGGREAGRPWIHGNVEEM
jgi:hypothetical protein